MKRIDLYNKSRMMGDYQVRFCERLRVKLPLPTRPTTVSTNGTENFPLNSKASVILNGATYGYFLGKFEIM